MPGVRRQPAAVVLCGGDHRATLAAARSLARAEIPFSVLGSGDSRVVAASRSIHLAVAGPDPDAEPEAFIEATVAMVRRSRAGLVIPVDDAAMLACVQERQTIESEAKLAAAPTTSVRNVRDKRANLETARRLGIPCPEQFKLEDLRQLPEMIDRLRFPIVLKNPGPSIDGRRKRFSFRFLLAHDEDQLRQQLATQCPAGMYPIFQEYVKGNVHNVCCFAVAGEIVAMHEYISERRLQGSGVFRTVTELTPTLGRYAEQMLCELSWDGVAQLGFFVSQDGRVWYMETNGRFWGSIEGSIRAGWDFPLWTCRYFADGEVPRPGPLAIGSRTCWHAGDLVALAGYLVGGDAPSSVPAGKSRAVFDYLTSFRPGVHADTFRLDDPLPAIVEHWRLAARALGRRGLRR